MHSRLGFVAQSAQHDTGDGAVHDDVVDTRDDRCLRAVGAIGRVFVGSVA